MNEAHYLLPKGYRLDVSDPDIWVLHEPDGSMLEAFWPEVATPENLRRAIEAYPRTLQDDRVERSA